MHKNGAADKDGRLKPGDFIVSVFEFWARPGMDRRSEIFALELAA